jgi:hypothetical protein
MHEMVSPSYEKQEKHQAGERECHGCVPIDVAGLKCSIDFRRPRLHQVGSWHPDPIGKTAKMDGPCFKSSKPKLDPQQIQPHQSAQGRARACAVSAAPPALLPRPCQVPPAAEHRSMMLASRPVSKHATVDGSWGSFQAPTTIQRCPGRPRISTGNHNATL